MSRLSPTVDGFLVGCDCQTCQTPLRKSRSNGFPAEPGHSRWEDTLISTSPTHLEYFRTFSAEVTFAGGISVQHIRTESETRHITVTNIPLGTTIAELRTSLSHLGKFEYLPLRPAPDGRSLYGHLILDCRTQAGMVVFSGIRIKNVELKFQIAPNGGEGNMLDTSPDKTGGSGNSALLYVRWEVPPTKAVVAFKSGVAVDTVRGLINETTVDGRKLRASFKRRKWDLPFSFDGSSKLLEIDGLPGNVTKETVQQVSRCTCIKSIKRRPNHLEHSLDSLHRDLETTAPNGVEDFRQHCFVESNTICVEVKFRSWDYALTAYNFLVNRTLPYLDGSRPSLRLAGPYRYTIRIPIQQYKARESALKNIAQDRSRGKGSVLLLASEHGQFASIEVVGIDKMAVGRLKVRVESLMAGEKLYIWDRFFDSDAADFFLENLSQKTGAWVTAVKHLKFLQVFGEPEAAASAAKILTKSVNELSSCSFTMEIQETALPFFLHFGLPVLREILGKPQVVLDLQSTRLAVTIIGGEDARHRLQSLVTESLVSGALSQHAPPCASCPVCLDIPTNPVRLDCGHTYCDGCIRHLLESACHPHSFPLGCIADNGNCQYLLSLVFIRQYLTSTRMCRLFEIALSVHLENNPQDYRYCPTPSCSQIYCVSTQPRVFNCPSCFSPTCACCGDLHPKYTCQEWKAMEGDRLLEEWVGGRANVKRCPRCQVYIEKADGCNRVRCQCKALICWKCMVVFPDGLYEHLVAVHGSAFDTPG